MRYFDNKDDAKKAMNESKRYKSLFEVLSYPTDLKWKDFLNKIPSFQTKEILYVNTKAQERHVKHMKNVIFEINSKKDEVVIRENKKFGTRFTLKRKDCKVEIDKDKKEFQLTKLGKKYGDWGLEVYFKLK